MPRCFPQVPRRAPGRCFGLSGSLCPRSQLLRLELSAEDENKLILGPWGPPTDHDDARRPETHDVHDEMRSSGMNPAQPGEGDSTGPSLYFNPSCSKCRSAQAILAEHHMEATIVRYLDRPPTVEELRTLMVKLGIDDPRQMIRTGEPVYSELGLGSATPTQLLEAIASHPILLERPIFVAGERAVIARPPERVLELQ